MNTWVHEERNGDDGRVMLNAPALGGYVLPAVCRSHLFFEGAIPSLIWVFLCRINTQLPIIGPANDALPRFHTCELQHHVFPPISSSLRLPPRSQRQASHSEVTVRVFFAHRPATTHRPLASHPH